jgi:hypothetical protein
MALRIDDATESLYTTSAGLNAQSVTIFFRVRRRGTGGATAQIAIYGQTSGSADAAQIAITGGTLTCWNGTGFMSRGSITTDVWYDVALTQAGSGAGNAKLYSDTTGSGSAMGSATAAGPSTADLGKLYLGFANSGNWANIELDDVRVWSVALTAAELESERLRRFPVRGANLVRWWPMVYDSASNNALDRSGNVSALTIGGTPTIVDGPAVGWGAPPSTPSQPPIYLSKRLMMMGVG